MPANTWIYVTSYDKQGGPGIHQFRLDKNTGVLELVDSIHSIQQSLFLEVSRNYKYAYAVNESATSGANSTLTAFSIDGQTGKLTILNNHELDGSDSCYLNSDETGKFLLVVNYMGMNNRGSVCVFSIETDGCIGTCTDTKQFIGSSVNPQRQRESHPHMAAFDPANRFVLISDLGTDKLMVFPFDASIGKLILPNTTFVPATSGAGPRHFAFHPDGQFIYLINELDNTITAYNWDKDGTTLQQIEKYPTLPDGYHEVSFASDLHVHPSGKFLYGANRGHNSIVIYEINTLSGHLKLVGHESTLGNWPRGFAIDADGEFLVLGNQLGDSLIVYRIHPENGTLQSVNQPTAIPAPVCIAIIHQVN